MHPVPAIILKNLTSAAVGRNFNRSHDPDLFTFYFKIKLYRKDKKKGPGMSAGNQQQSGAYVSQTGPVVQ